MSIKAVCQCGKSFNVPEKFRGKRGKCPSCGEPVLVGGEEVPEVSSTAKTSKKTGTKKTTGKKKTSVKSTSPKRSVKGGEAKGSRSGGRRSTAKRSSGAVPVILGLLAMGLLAGGGFFAYKQMNNSGPSAEPDAMENLANANSGAGISDSDHADVTRSEGVSRGGIPIAEKPVMSASANEASTVPTGREPSSDLSQDDAYDRVQARIKALGIDVNKSLFFPEPKVGKTWNVKNLGPVGLGIDLVKPGFSMKIQNVEKGSPAEKTGKFKKGQIIESINGKVMEGKDPRYILGDIVTEAEAADGKVVFEMKEGGTVTVDIPVMGSYSRSWPVNCQKSDKIVRNLADLIGKLDKPRWGSVLFLLSTGEEKDLDVVRKWMDGIETIGQYPWHKGYMGPGLCEYYLRTGDEKVLPVIKKMSEELLVMEYNGGWSGRGRASYSYMGGGQLHAAGVHCLTFLLLARMCGVEVDEGMLQRSLKAFYRFAGRGNVAYGNQLPEGGFRDNGKSGGLAVAMAAAARLVPEGEDSNYARARDNSALKSFYATNWFHAAHTGGGIGEIWHHAGMGLIREKRPMQYRSYMDTRRWVMDLSRRWDGGIGIAGMTDGYDASVSEKENDWGTFFALTYTYHRKHLQLYGAPKTEWCKTYSLPVRAWGTPSDDWFLLMTPVEDTITSAELMEEIAHADSSAPIMGRIREGSKKFKESYLGHPEFGLRSGTMRTLVGEGRSDLVMPLLQSKDPRMRHNGVLAITGMFKGSALPSDLVTNEMYDEIGKIIENREESWWVLQDAINALIKGGKARVTKHKDRLLEILDINAWWVQMAAVKALAIIAYDDEHYKELLPPLVETYSGFTANMSQSVALKALKDGMTSAPAPIKGYAFQLLRDTFGRVPENLTFPGGYTVPQGGVITRSRFSELMQVHPEGSSFVKKLPKKTLAYVQSEDKNELFEWKGSFKGDKKFVGTWDWAVWPRPKTEKDLKGLAEKWAKNKKRGKPKTSFTIEDEGVIKRQRKGAFSGYFWHEDYLVGINQNIARKMEIRQFGGKDFLLVENPDFENYEKNDFNGKYSLFMRR